MPDFSPKELLILDAQSGALSGLDALLSENESFRSVCNEVREKGTHSLGKRARYEIKSYDPTFIDELEKGFNAIERIVTSPRTSIKTEGVLVEAGLAKKINSESVTHLASHTQYVNQVNDDGTVTPKKILTIESDLDYATYENRFVITLIRKAAQFIEKRYQFIKEHQETRDSNVLILHSSVEMDGALFELDQRVKISSPSADEGKSEQNAKLILRLSRCRERCAYFNHSSFATALKSAKAVANPIHMTNLLLKNPDYHRAYELWTFLDSYESLGVNYDVKELNENFTEQYLDEIYGLATMSLLSCKSHLIDKKTVDESGKKSTVKPKIIFSLEDETFYEGKFLYDQFPNHERPEQAWMLSPLEASEEHKALQAHFKEQGIIKKMVDDEIDIQRQKDLAEEAAERLRLQQEEEERLAALEKAQAEEAERRAQQLAEEKAKELAAQAEEEARKLAETRQRLIAEAEAAFRAEKGLAPESSLEENQTFAQAQAEAAERAKAAEEASEKARRKRTRNASFAAIASLIAYKKSHPYTRNVVPMKNTARSTIDRSSFLKE